MAFTREELGLHQMFEIWGMDNTSSDMDGGERRFREDCYSFDEAKAACREWQSDGRAAWVIDKDSGQQVWPAP